MSNTFQYPSILIPHVWKNISRDFIIYTLENQQIGNVARVDMIPRENSENYMAFVHFNTWYSNTAAQNLRNKILRGEEGRIVYDDPWHWITVKAKNPRLNLINEEDVYESNVNIRKDSANIPDVSTIRNGIQLIANQNEAQGKMIRYLNEDLFDADHYIFELEKKITELLNEPKTEPEVIVNTEVKTEHIPHMSDNVLETRAIQWASGHFLTEEMPAELIEAEEGEQVNCEYNGEIYETKYDFAVKNCCEQWEHMKDYPETLYEKISDLGWSFKNSCFEFIGKTQKSYTEVAQVPSHKKKVHFHEFKSTPAAASPSKLPTPSTIPTSEHRTSSHFVDNLTIDTDFQISDDEIDDGDFDCGNFSEMASRHVAQEISYLKRVREGTPLHASRM